MRSYALTDVGKTRSLNQDTVFASDVPVGRLPNLYIVADGMGGHKAGDIASRFSVETLLSEIRNSSKSNPITIISDAIRTTNKNLIELAQTSPDYFGMGTTLVVLTVIGTSAYIANVGDSRLYILGDSFTQITRDHSLVEEMVNNGSLKREEARTHARKNVITRAIGGDADVMADFFEVELNPGDRILMCSDGLSNMLEDEMMEYILLQDETLKYRAEKLVASANDAGGRDNISVIIAEQ